MYNHMITADEILADKKKHQDRPNYYRLEDDRRKVFLKLLKECNQERNWRERWIHTEDLQDTWIHQRGVCELCSKKLDLSNIDLKLEEHSGYGFFDRYLTCRVCL